MKYTLDEVEYNIPNVISIENYSKIYKVKDLFTDEYFSAKLINIVSGAPLELLLEADYQEVNYMAAYVLSLMPIDKPKFTDRFELDGVQYGFFPKWQDLSFAEFVDMDTISTKKPDELLNMLHILCAVMYRPITNERTPHDFDIEKYNVHSMTQRAELFKKLDVRYVLGAQTFFIRFAEKFSTYTHLSLIPTLTVWTKIKLGWKLRKYIWRAAFNKPLDGTLSSTDLLETILQNTTISTKRK